MNPFRRMLVRRLGALGRMAIAIGIFVTAAGPAAAAAVAPSLTTEFPVSSSGVELGGIVAGPDGNLWFTELSLPKIGRMTLNGTVTEYSISGRSDSITVGPDGNLWFTEITGPFRIGRLTPAGVLTEFALSLPFFPTGNATPNGMSITSGPDGNLWLTAILFQRVSPFAVSLIGRMTVTGSLTLVVPALPGSEVFQITAGPDGNLWFPEINVNVIPWRRGIGQITREGTLREFTFSFESGVPNGIAVGPDGNLWITEGDSIRRIAANGTSTAFPLPTLPTTIFANSIVAGPDGNLWFTGPNAGVVGRITVDGTITVYPLSNCSLRTLSALPDLTAGPDGNIWLTECTDVVIRLDVRRADGIPLVWRNVGTGDVSVWQMNGTRQLFQASLAHTVPLTWQVAGVADLDGDGSLDLLWRNTQTGDVAAWLLEGAAVRGSVIVSPSVSLAWEIVGVGDVDGDGKADIVWRDVTRGDVAIWLMNGGSVRQSALFSLGVPPLLSAGVPLAWQIAGIGDVNGDGRADLVWRHAQSGDVAVWLLNGTNVEQTLGVSAGVPLVWQIGGVSDIDGDGHADLIWRQTQTGDLAAWLMDGSGVKQSSIMASVPPDWQIALLRDLDGDGIVDVVWRKTDGEVAVWLLHSTVVIEDVLLGLFPSWLVQ